jgi:uncharacterized protein (DUF2267 family)
VAKKNHSDLVVTTHFDYQVLTPTQRTIVQQRTGEIRERLQRSAQDIWEIGQRLVDVRSALKHGQFETWLKAEFGWSRRTAYNFINVYETFRERANLAQIDIATSALYLLAAPSTPQEVREQYLQQAKAGKKVTHKDLRETIERERPAKLRPDALSETVEAPSTTVEIFNKPEIVTVIPRSGARSGATDGAVAVDVMVAVVVETSVNSAAALKPGWYLLDQQHLVFCGDTASSDFYTLIPEAAFALAATGNDWDHDWLVEAAKTVTILPEATLQNSLIEQLITLFSQRQETVIFPWLPNENLIAIAHRMGRKVVAGDLSRERCYQAMQATGLQAVKIE